MSPYQSLFNQFTGKRPLLNIVLDGYGIGKNDHTDAIFQAQTPFMDYLKANFAHTTLFTHGFHVGLPGIKDLGGSEAGHITIGAGKIISQGPTLINNSINDGSFFDKPVLGSALENAKSNALHLIGLLSDGNVHSHISHFIAVIEEAVRAGISKCYVHALLDGRDVGIQTADIYIEKLDFIFSQIVSDHPAWEYGFASGGGREVITMDRDKNWQKVEAGWKTHVQGLSGNDFPSALDAIQHFRSKSPGLIDQDCPPFNILDSKNKRIEIEDGDSVIFMNFRADRAVELTRAFTEEGFNEFEITHKPEVYFAGMMVYDEDDDIPQNRIMGSPVIENPFGKRILELGLDQFRLTETQKYAHVTFFFNGGYRNPLDPQKENYYLIESDKINSFAAAPKMKAMEIAAKAVEFIQSERYDYGLINFPNSDMVGHTGNMEATIKAVETVDIALKQICTALTAINGIAIITADHGNGDEMLLFNKKTSHEEICTKHSINPVPLIIFDPSYKRNYALKQQAEDTVLDLSMIAATNFILMNRPVPSDINDSLFLI